jgi:MinD-like ATPase involved in chromosome partitioning or flagellar assembly
MLTACWSAKGGTGTTVVAATLALLAGRSSRDGSLLVDLAGDAPATLGLPQPDGPGAAEWLAAGDDVPADALGRLEQRAAPGVSLLPRGVGALSPARAEVLAAVLAADPRAVVVDCGVVGGDAPDASAALAVALAADRSLLVTRACYLALRRALAAPLRPSEVVLVREPGRALTGADVADALGAPVLVTVEVDPAIARAVDAGLLGARLPRLLERCLADAA